MEITWQHIHNPKAIAVLTNASTREILKPFMLGTETIKSVAEKLGLPLNAVHHKVKQFEKIGLLKVTHLETRRGRSIKHYQSTAQGYFVPFVATTSEGLSGFVKQQMQPYLLEFMELIAIAGSSLIQDINQVGVRIYNAGGYINTDLSPRGQGFDFAEFLTPEAPAIMSSLMPMKLTKTDAKNLQLEMLHLLEKYGNLGGTHDYVVHIGLSPGQIRSSE
jgi:hypothetical protein